MQISREFKADSSQSSWAHRDKLIHQLSMLTLCIMQLRERVAQTQIESVDEKLANRDNAYHHNRPSFIG